MKVDRRKFVAALAGLFLIVCSFIFRPRRALPDQDIAGIENNAGTRGLGEALQAGGFTMKQIPRGALVRLQQMRAGEVAERIRDDFVHSRIRLVDGWVLSETEAIACRYYAERAE